MDALPLRSSPPRVHGRYSFRASRSRPYLFCINPKVASSSILWTLQRLELADPTIVPSEPGEIHVRERSALDCLRPAEALELISRRPGVFKFCFVRNPFDRILSCYFGKIVQPTPQRSKVLKLLGLGGDDERNIGFEEFVSGIARQDPGSMDPHWAVQSDVTLQDQIQYQAIGRFEQFDPEFAQIGRSLDPDFARYVYSELRHAVGPKPYNLLTPPLADMVRSIYQRDFSGFGYSLDLPAP